MLQNKHNVKQNKLNTIFNEYNIQYIHKLYYILLCLFLCFPSIMVCTYLLFDVSCFILLYLFDTFCYVCVIYLSVLCHFVLCDILCYVMIWHDMLY